MSKKFGSVEERRAYMRQHAAVARARGRAREHVCPCGADAAEWAQIHDTTGDSPDHFEAMCRKCHQKYDDRWNPEERAKVSASLRKMWDNSPERKQSMRDLPHRSRRLQGGDA